MSKEKEALIKSSEDNIDLYYNMRFEDIFKTQVLLNADKQFKKIFEALEYEYNATFTKYNQNQNTSYYNFTIQKLDDVIIDKIDEVIKLFIEKINVTYSQENINENFEE